MIASGLSGSGDIDMNLEFSFGRIVVDGQICNNDIKIVSGKLVPDWWRKSGHTVEIEDVNVSVLVAPIPNITHPKTESMP